MVSETNNIQIITNQLLQIVLLTSIVYIDRINLLQQSRWLKEKFFFCSLSYKIFFQFQYVVFYNPSTAHHLYSNHKGFINFFGGHLNWLYKKIEKKSLNRIEQIFRLFKKTQSICFFLSFWLGWIRLSPS